MRVLPGGESNSRRGTDRGIDVEIGEFDALGSEPVDVLGFDGASETGEVGISHVINEDDDDVWSGDRSLRTQRSRDAKEENKDKFHLSEVGESFGGILKFGGIHIHF